MPYDIAKLTRIEFFKHPISKKKLRSIDIFQSAKNFNCAQCQSVGRPMIYCLSSDHGNIKGYFVIKCQGCENQTWYVNTTVSFETQKQK